MTQAWLSVVLVVIFLAMLPIGLKWVQRRVQGTAVGPSSSLRVVSAVAVGTHQKVVVVEMAIESRKILLTLGVSPSSVSCLHTHELQDFAAQLKQVDQRGDQPCQ